VVPNETLPLYSSQGMATARNASTPFAVHVMPDNALANGSVNDRKTIEDETERQRIQHHRQSDEVQSQIENPLPGQEMDTVARQGRDLATTRPDDEEERMGLEEPLSMDPIGIPPGGREIDSHSDDEASWEWVDKPSEHTDQRLPLLYRRQQTPWDDLRATWTGILPIALRDKCTRNTRSGLQHCQ